MIRKPIASGGCCSMFGLQIGPWGIRVGAATARAPTIPHSCRLCSTRVCRRRREDRERRDIPRPSAQRTRLAFPQGRFRALIRMVVGKIGAQPEIGRTRDDCLHAHAVGDHRPHRRADVAEMAPIEPVLHDVRLSCTKCATRRSEISDCTLRRRMCAWQNFNMCGKIRPALLCVFNGLRKKKHWIVIPVVVGSSPIGHPHQISLSGLAPTPFSNGFSNFPTGLLGSRRSTHPSTVIMLVRCGRVCMGCEVINVHVSAIHLRGNRGRSAIVQCEIQRVFGDLI